MRMEVIQHGCIIRVYYASQGQIHVSLMYIGWTYELEGGTLCLFLSTEFEADLCKLRKVRL